MVVIKLTFKYSASMNLGMENLRFYGFKPCWVRIDDKILHQH